MPLSAILAQLAAIAAQHDPAYPAALQPGLSRAALTTRLRAAGFAWQPPEEWFTLYQWRNGSTATEEGAPNTPLFNYHAFMTLEEALAERALWNDVNAAMYSVNRDMTPPDASPATAPAQEEEADFVPYPPHLLPVFCFEGECYAVECHVQAQAHGRVHFLYQGDWVCYDSLQTMLAAKLECHRTAGIYVRDADGCENCADPAACAAILLRHNPCRAAELGDAAHP